MVDLPIPGNDDAIRSIQLFCKEMCEAMTEGYEIRSKDAPQGTDVAQVSEEEKAQVIEEAMGEEDVVFEEEGK